MEAICSSETSVDTQQATRRYIPEDGTLHNHRCENLKIFRLIFPTNILYAFLIFPSMLNKCPISSSLIWLPQQYRAKCTSKC
jgi:hypothetical protein